MSRDYLAESALLRRMVQGLGIRVAVLGEQRHLTVSNMSMSLDPDELAIIAQAIRARP